MSKAIPDILTAGGGLLSAGGTIAGANSEARSLREQAAQLETQAGQDRASSQRAAIEERRRARYIASRGLTLAAATGAGADDPTVVNNFAAIGGEGEYRALTAMFEGETEAQGKEAQARMNRNAAKATKTAGFLKAAGTILSTASSIFGR